MVHDATAGSPPDAAAPADVVLDVQAGGPAGEFTFTPATLSASEGAVVRVVLHNAGRAPHTFTLPEFDADAGEVAPGGEATVTFRATREGSFAYWCSVAGHRQAGMVGRLDVAGA